MNKFKVCAIGVLLVIFSLSCVFFLDRMFAASQSPLWLDEHYGLKRSTRYPSYGELIVRGAQSQGSAAPLDFLIIKSIDKMKTSLNWLGLRPHVYYRLFANLVTVFSGLLIFILFLKEVYREKEHLWLRYVQLLLLILGIMSYYYAPVIHHYAAEMRPYALWSSLWFIVLGLTLLRVAWMPYIFVTLILLSFSATASIFQMGALGICYFFLSASSNRKQSLVEIVKVFGLPIFIALYYCLQVQQFDHPAESNTWNNFFTFWSHKAYLLPLLIMVTGFCLFQKKSKSLAIAPASVVLLTLMGPLIFFITRLKGVFLAERHYIYYDHILPITILTLVVVFPIIIERINSKVWQKGVVIGLVLIAIIVTFRPAVNKRFKASVINGLYLLKDASLIKQTSLDKKFTVPYWDSDKLIWEAKDFSRASQHIIGQAVWFFDEKNPRIALVHEVGDDKINQQSLIEIVKQHYSTGELKVTVPYLDGEIHGDLEMFYKDGSYKALAQYVKGQQHGLTRKYYKNGKLQAEGAFVAGKTQGKSLFYYENGSVQREDHFEKGQLLQRKQFNQDGQLISEKKF